MRERAVQAARYGARVGLVAGILCAILLIVDHDAIGFLLFVPAAWFVAIFIIVFTLAYAFPPAAGRLALPGARKFVWPIVALLTVATVVALVWKK